MSLARPRVEALLANAWSRRVTLVTAGGGWGKTTALRALAGTGRCRWLGMRPVDREIELLSARLAEALELGAVAGVADPGAAIGAEDRQALAEGQAAVLCEALQDDGGELLLVLDDLDRLGEDSAAVHLVRALVLQAPPQLHLVLSRQRLPELGAATAGRFGEVLEVNAPDLAFTRAEIDALLTARLGDADPELVERCRALTGGWAAALAVIVDRLSAVEPARRRAALERVPVLDGEVWREFVGELIDAETPGARRTLFLAAIAPVVHVDLLAALDVEDPHATLAGLTNRGLVVAAADNVARTMSPALMAAVWELLPEAEGAELRERAASWLESADRLGEALECRVRGPETATRALLVRRGHALVARGYGARVADVVRSVGIGDVPGLGAILGEALQSVGDWDGAMETFGRVHREAPGGRLEPQVAWRFGALLYFRGESALALEVLSSADVVGDDRPADDALVSAWLSSTLWSRGESGRAAQAAATALAQAERSRDPAALAAAHVACALAAASAGERERNERHYRAALHAAAEAGDSIQLARIRANLSSRALEEGEYQRAIEEADNGLRVGAGHRFFAALAMCNKAEALMRLGELEAARATLVESVAIYDALGSLLASAPHTMLGELYRERGDLGRARLAFERAQRLAEAAEDVHTLVWAVCGLARALAADDPELARRHAAEALERSSSLERAHALCTSAWVELVAGDHVAAVTHASAAEREARATGDRPALADSLTLQGMASRPPREQPLRTAAQLWGEVGNRIAERRTLLLLADTRGETTEADALRDQLAELGVVPEFYATRPGWGPLTIATLGRFAVQRGGEHVRPAAWQSRKARDLLKLLVGRLGKPITRDAAAEALWPGEPAGPLSNRLSVALSTVRKVLDPDRAHPADHFIAADKQSLRLRVEHVSVDVVEFLRVADEAIASGSEDHLRDAERRYTGDFLEEDIYEDWSVDCRERARSTALEVGRLLARAASGRGDDETASRHLRRVLEHDPYDEDAWLELVRSQLRLRRHGEARRQHAIYARRMAELDIAPVALADVTSADA